MSSMKIVWVVPQYALKTDAAGLRTNIASIRYRALIPAQGLIARGHLASVVGLNAERSWTKCASSLRGPTGWYS